MDVLRRSAGKSRMDKIRNRDIKEIMGAQEKPDIIDNIKKKRLQWYRHVKRMPEQRLPKLIMEWIPVERKKKGRPKKTWMEAVQEAIPRVRKSGTLCHCWVILLPLLSPTTSV